MSAVESSPPAGDPPTTGATTRSDGPYARARQAADQIRESTGIDRFDVAVVLGSGLGSFAESLAGAQRLSMDDLIGFAPPGVPGHAGAVVAGRLGSRSVLVLAGRVHLYEGHDVHQVCHAVRTAAATGVGTAVLTNAAGGIDPSDAVGALVRIGDHLNLSGANPLTGPHDGPQPGFVDLSTAYDADLRALAARVAPDMAEGVYAGLAGPSFETPAEIRMLATMGATLVGMSTTCETIALRQLGVRVAAFSLVTNRAAGLGEPLSHQEVTAVGQAAATDVVEFLTAFVDAVGTGPPDGADPDDGSDR
jgi:purine-nucleoside phosphorylase